MNCHTGRRLRSLTQSKTSYIARGSYTLFNLVPGNGHQCVFQCAKHPSKGFPRLHTLWFDYWDLNAITVGDRNPIPSVDNILDAICNSKYFGKLVLANGQWQVLLNLRDKAKKAFPMHIGLYEFLRLLFGFKTAPEIFQMVLNTVFCEFLYVVSNLD